MVRWREYDTVHTIEGDGVEPIDAASSVFDPAEAVRQFLGAVDAEELNRVVLDRMGPGSDDPAVLVLDVLKEWTGGA
jgi:hypothetical protein